MTLRDNIAAVLADGSLTEVQKRRAVRLIRNQGWRDALPALPHTFTVGQYAVTVLAVSVDADKVSLTLSATRNGNPLPKVAALGPWDFYGPPLLVQDPAGDIPIEIRGRDGTLVETRMFAERPLQALREQVVHTVVAALR